jgi:hypothetical protein
MLDVENKDYYNPAKSHHETLCIFAAQKTDKSGQI